MCGNAAAGAAFSPGPRESNPEIFQAVEANFLKDSKWEVQTFTKRRGHAFHFETLLLFSHPTLLHSGKMSRKASKNTIRRALNNINISDSVMWQEYHLDKEMGERLPGLRRKGDVFLVVTFEPVVRESSRFNDRCKWRRGGATAID
ncbi:hypothetical protein C8F04DRAFT_1195038 [Mycena alexandri]|uniref:Uncharacterized protein n=1 Tax=Mycena alexandri TaxID=1745969 RepID=A0AAD6S6Q2_9AGAR|nr:hypothetical protein C8F04DRAFT_1195038 [Mycena alexandri]